MKKIISIAFIALVTLSAFAQKQQKTRKHPKFTADQIAELQTKQMTLNLDLNERQQQQILAINKKNALERKQMMEARKTLHNEGGRDVSSKQAFEQKSKRLDKQIALKSELKKILTEEQFNKFQKAKKFGKHKIKKRVSKRKMQQKRMRTKGKRVRRR